ncbi:DUF4153 domain-containing protein [Actinomycetes bacterium M1A6_2h]
MTVSLEKHAPLWPETDDETDGASLRVIAAAVAAGVVATLTLDPSVPSIGFVLTGVAVVAAVVSTGRLSFDPSRTMWAATALVLLGVAGLRDSGWLIATAVVVAALAAGAALVPGRTWTTLALAPLMPVVGAVRTALWIDRGRPEPDLRRRFPVTRIVVVGSLTLMLVLVFGVLFASADDKFADVISAAVPTWSVDVGLSNVVTLVVVAAVVLSARYVLGHRPLPDRLAPSRPKARPVWDWAIPVLAVDAVFTVFVAVQLDTFFGGDEHVVSEPGLTYADYARSGFWQLLIVTALVLAVVAIVVRRIDTSAARDQRLARIVLGGLCLLTLVVVASAVHRMALYENEFGYTRLRLSVMAVELWLGVVFVILLLAGVRMSARLLPRTVLMSGAVAVLVVAAVNPDAYIAERNVDRYKASGRIDTSYLSTLSADAVPALDALDRSVRGCAVDGIDVRDDAWWEFNAARNTARSILADRPAAPCF